MLGGKPSSVNGEWAAETAHYTALTFMKGKEPLCVEQTTPERKKHGKTCEPMAAFSLWDITGGVFEGGCRNVPDVAARIENILRRVYAKYRFELVEAKLKAGA